MKCIAEDGIVSQSWKSFITEGKIYNKEIRKEIADSWIRSKKAGVDPYTKKFRFTLYNEDEAEALYQDWEYTYHVAYHYLVEFYQLMEDNHSCVFYVDDNYIVNIQRGCKDLIRYLNSKNIGLGANFKEGTIGTNAAGLALSTKSWAMVIGSEHYVEALKEFSCCATTYINAQSKLRCILFFTQVSNFNPLYIDLLKTFTNLIKSSIDLDLYKVAKELETLSYEHINISLDQQDSGLIYVESRGIILKANKFILDSLGIKENDILGYQLGEIFPELFSAMDCMTTGKAIHFKEVQFSRNRQNRIYYMDCQPYKKNDRCIGMTIALYSSKRINRNVANLANFTAHFVFDDIIGSSPKFIAVKETAKSIADSKSSVFITGESGTGKELFAQAIHNASNRAQGPFISINCAAIPRELIGSELFGYTDGAFTGARKGGAPGKFELADRGTVFLDEIGDMPLDMQAALLRVLEEKKVNRLGASFSIPVDVRLITATNKNLLNAISSGEFRLDLYYRINIIQIEIPPLRERYEDIPQLVDYFIKQFNQSLGKNVSGVTPKCMDLLKSHCWPGNVRELRNVIERCINKITSAIITEYDLPQEMLTSNFTLQHQSSQQNPYNHRLVGEFSRKFDEERQILELMNKFKGNKARVAKELGMTRATLYRKLKAIGEETSNR